MYGEGEGYCKICGHSCGYADFCTEACEEEARKMEETEE